MPTLTFRYRLILCLLLPVFALSGYGADQLAAGDAFPRFEDSLDQHGEAYPLPEGTRYVAVAFTMSVGKAANRYLASQEADYLPEHDAVFVSNIHGMPAVGRFFAMPKMKKYAHRILLADAEGLLDALPQEDGRVTIFELTDDGSIRTIRFWDPDSDEAPGFGGQ